MKNSNPTKYNLRPQEIRVLQMASNDMKMKQVAAALSITLKTAEKHAEIARYKLGVNSISGAVGKALREKIIE
jgi:DNA-binding CsgD family transcriptional regulator